jgi:hypothetical protein
MYVAAAIKNYTITRQKDLLKNRKHLSENSKVKEENSLDLILLDPKMFI